MAEERPRPQYGEYASPEEQILAGGTAVTPPENSPRNFAPPVPGTQLPGGSGDVAKPGATAELAPEKRPFDTFVTTFILSLSAFIVISSSGGWADLPATLIQTYEQLGYGEFTSIELASTMGTVIAVVQSALLIMAAIMSIARLRARRASWWVPLVFGVISIVVTLILMMIVMMTDPALAAYLASTR